MATSSRFARMDVGGFALALALIPGVFACTFNHEDLGPRLRGSGGETSVGTGGSLDSGGADTPIGAGGMDGAAVGNDFGSGGRSDGAGGVGGAGGATGGTGGFLDARSGDTQRADAGDVSIVGNGGMDGAGGATRGLGGAAGTDTIMGTGGTAGDGGGTVSGLAVFAGVPSNGGSVDGEGAAARFCGPRGMAVDGSGNLFIADNCHTIRKVTPAGVVTTLAGTARLSGSADGTGAAARFYYPSGLAIDGSGNLFVTDRSNHTVRKITPAGVVTTLAGTAGLSGSGDGPASSARFLNPSGAAVDESGNVFIADSSNNTIRKITPSGWVYTLAGAAGSSGSADGTTLDARFELPSGVAVDKSGNVFVADSSNHTIRKITPAGQVLTLAGAAGSSGSVDGTGASVRFNMPYGVAVDSEGNVFVADTYNYTIRKITPTGVTTTIAGTAGSSGSADGTGAAARFGALQGVAVDGTGNVFVADTSNYAVRKVTPAGVVITLAGTPRLSGSADGTGVAARFYLPQGVAVDGAGNVFVADTPNHTIRKVTPAGVVTTLAGTAGLSGSMDGTGAAVRFNMPYGVAVDREGNVFVADTYNDTIRKITPSGVAATIAGAGSSGSADGTGAAARFNLPQGVAVDGAGNVFVADTSNHTLRKVTPAGVVTTLAGTASLSGSVDGTGAAARFYLPQGVAVDGAGNVFVADTSNYTIRKVTPTGAVITLAGTAGSSGGVDGTGGAALLNKPSGVAVDGEGDVFVADTYNHAIRKITASGVVSTVVGVAAPTSMGNSPGPLPASIAFPVGVAIDLSNGHLYITLPDAVMVAVLPN